MKTPLQVRDLPINTYWVQGGQRHHSLSPESVKMLNTQLSLRQLIDRAEGAYKADMQRKSGVLAAHVTPMAGFGSCDPDFSTGAAVAPGGSQQARQW